MDDVNKRIKELRLKLGLTQGEFGEKIGLSKSGVSNIENGTRNVSERHIKLISITFGVSEVWIRNGIDEIMLSNETKQYEQFDRSFQSDIGNMLGFLINQLESDNHSLRFSGMDLDDELREVLKNSLSNIYETAKLLNKK